ncbi:glycosyltransferase [Arthrobacter sp. UYEF3]|uniref:glycosyltransferase n=1 Tax=Arthrobacter sp. UYEF3 TaxID=1756365 RepID=UPI0033963DA5
MNRYKVSYYAHHFGTGHLRHAQKVAASELFDLQVTSTGPRKDTLLNGTLEYVELSPDVGSAAPPAKVSSDSYLHFAPTGDLIQQRFAELNRAWKEFNPDVVMVDVSVEVALFARLSGYPVAFRRMPGNRRDQAHQMAYSLADALFAYFPSDLEDPRHMEIFGHKSHYLSVAQPSENSSSADPTKLNPAQKSRVVVQTSLASSIRLYHVACAAAKSPEWDWEVVGAVEADGTPLPANLILHGVLSDPIPIMHSADLIISSAGHNAVVAAASCHRPVLLVPEDRPFEEQHTFARNLNTSANIKMLDTWESPVNWSEVLEQAALSVPEGLAKALFVKPADFTAKLHKLIHVCALGTRVR